MNNDIQDVLVFIFEEGLDEDAFYRSDIIVDNLPSIENLLEQKLKVKQHSLEYRLLDALIKDIKSKS